MLASKDNNVRILDVPGFSDSGALTSATRVKVGVYEGNLQIFRWIVRVQATLKITMDRVVYFLPYRGPLEKVYGILQDELKVMYHFFGSGIFENMVVVATNHAEDQDYGFEAEDKEDTERVLHTALKLVTGDEKIFCPPIVYIALQDTGKKILTALISAPVKTKIGMALKFRDDICAKCTVRTRYATAPGSKEPTRVGVVDSNGETTKYEDSKCHTKFVPRYTGAQKFWMNLWLPHPLTYPASASSKSRLYN